jgi:soluble lytic murein transglycosylase-like protein
MKIKNLLAVLLAIFTIAYAPHALAQAAPTPANDPNACWRAAAQYHGVDIWLLYSIAWVESRMNPQSVGKNKNGSLDLGMMQINTIWLQDLGKYGIKQEQLMDGCTSIYIGAWIMAKNFKNYGYTWRAIGAYNSANPGIGYKYAQKVYDVHRRITGMPTIYYGQATQASELTPKH